MSSHFYRELELQDCQAFAHSVKLHNELSIYAQLFVHFVGVSKVNFIKGLLLRFFNPRYDAYCTIWVKKNK